MLVPRLTESLTLYKAQPLSLPEKELKYIYGTRTESGPRTRTEQEPQGHRIKQNPTEPQRTEIKDRTRRTHRPQPLKKLPGNYTTTMPRNTAAGKATAGPSNTSDGETIAVSTPREELAAANAEIERLRELLEARDTPASSDDSSDRLATILEALAQRTASSRSAKVADPPLLTDGTDPTFDNWKLQLRDKLEVNEDHFPNNRARMAYVFGRTGGDAQTHLRPRYAEESADPFTSEEEIINHLSSIYEDPFKVQNARLNYKVLNMKITETFSTF